MRKALDREKEAASLPFDSPVDFSRVRVKEAVRLEPLQDFLAAHFGRLLIEQHASVDAAQQALGVALDGLLFVAVEGGLAHLTAARETNQINIRAHLFIIAGRFFATTGVLYQRLSSASLAGIPLRSYLHQLGYHK